MKTYYVGAIPVSDELYHYGILGQKWGVRRYQNPDGSYTEAGKLRYSPKPKTFMPYISMLNPDTIAAGLTKLNYRQSNSRDKADTCIAKIKKLKEKQKTLDPNSKQYLVNADRINVLTKRYVEGQLEHISYLTLMDNVINEATSLGYTVETKPVRGKYKDESKRPFYYDVKGDIKLRRID